MGGMNLTAGAKLLFVKGLDPKEVRQLSSLFYSRAEPREPIFLSRTTVNFLLILGLLPTIINLQVEPKDE
jgi:hypothetical protein